MATAQTSTPDTTTTTEKHAVRLAPTRHIDRFISRELSTAMDEDLYLLAILRDRERTYLLNGDVAVDVTSAQLALAPRRCGSRDRQTRVASVWWGNSPFFNGKAAMVHYHRWEKLGRTALLTYTGRTLEWTEGRLMAVLQSSVPSEAGEPQYVLVQQRYLLLMLRDLDELEHCVLEMLPGYRIRVRADTHIIGMVMPLAKAGRVLSTEADLADELDDDEDDEAAEGEASA